MLQYVRVICDCDEAWSVRVDDRVVRITVCFTHAFNLGASCSPGLQLKLAHIRFG